MIGKELVEKKPVTLPEVAEILEGLEYEQTYEQRISYEYAKEFGKVEPERARELVEALKGEGIGEEVAVKIVNLMPKDKEDLRVILAKEREGPGEDAYDRILEILWG